MGEPHGAMATRPGRALTSTVTHCTPAPSAGTHPRESASLFGTPPPPPQPAVQSTPPAARLTGRTGTCPSQRRRPSRQQKTDVGAPWRAGVQPPANPTAQGGGASHLGPPASRRNACLLLSPKPLSLIMSPR